MRDPVSGWAREVLYGKEVMGPDVRAACARHLRDLKDAKKRGYYWDIEAALHAIDFFRDLLFVEVDGADAPFDLLGWQLFTVGSLFGWKRIDTGYRRFTIAYVEAGKGSGKTPLAAGLGIYMMIADKELGAEVYAAAANKEQARITFDDAVKMVEASPILSERLARSGDNPVWQLRHRPSRSVFKPVSSSRARSGFRVSCALIDELHEHKNNYILEMMKAGTKKRTQPLIFIITNSGFDRKSVCWQYHEDALAIAHGLRENDQFFSLVFSLDPEDDPLEDESCWPKTNPGIGRTITLEYLRERVSNARAIPGQESITRRLNFCEWTDAENPWMTRKAWSECEDSIVKFERGAAVIPNEYGDAICAAAVDLSFSFDLTALAFAFPEADDTVTAWIEYFTPSETAAEREHRDKTPYTTWIKQGLIHPVPGKVVRREYLANRLAEVKASYDLESLAYDRYGHKALAQEVLDLGVALPWIEHPQGFRRGGLLVDPISGDHIVDPKTGKPAENPLWMPDSVRELETLIIEKRLRVQESPVTRWQVSSTVIRQDPAGTGNRVFNKNKALGRIDGVVALAMAIGALKMRRPSKPDIGKFLSSPVIAR